MNVRMLETNELPFVDFHLLTQGDEEERQQEAATLRECFREVGFLVLRNHNVDLSLIRESLGQLKEFFASHQFDKDTLDRRRIDQKRYGSVGYFPFQMETAITSTVPDLKEFFQMGRDPEECEIENCAELFPKNEWPAWQPQLSKVLPALYAEFNRCGDALIHAIGSGFSNLGALYLNHLVKDGSSILRTIHYPPVGLDVGGAERAAAHTGINLLGLQPPSTDAGLQFCTPAGEWVVPRRLEADWMTINAGEMLSFLTDGEITPTLHRVVNGQDGSEQSHRYTIVFFYMPNPAQYLRPPVESRQAAIKAGEWLMDRLRKIGIAS